MLRDIISALTENDIAYFDKLIFIYCIVSLIFIFSRILFYKTGWNPIMHDGITIYYKKYLGALVQADGNIVDAFGTGRLISTLTK